MTPPLRPTGWHAIDDFGHTTATRPAMLTDEWAEEHLTPEAAPQMSRAEMDEAAGLLSTLHQLVGEQAAEVMSFLVVILHRRDGSSMAMLRWLRSLDGMARGDS